MLVAPDTSTGTVQSKPLLPRCFIPHIGNFEKLINAYNIYHIKLQGVYHLMWDPPIKKIIFEENSGLIHLFYVSIPYFLCLRNKCQK